jgi:signal transduction histidine kinase/ActR/RegA family two-component response regulator/HAMP domain-containing protein
MKRLSSLPLRFKVLALSVGVASLGIVLGAALLVVDQRHNAREVLLDSATARAGTLAMYLAGPLTFEDEEGAAGLLSQLRTDPVVLRAILYDAEGKPFAQFSARRPRSPLPAPRLEAWSGFVGERLDTFEPVRVDGRTIGSLYIASSARGLERRAQRSLLITAAVSVLLIVACGLVAARLSRFITAPVQRLVGTMNEISQGGALTTRVSLPNQDELAALYTGFNAMLDELAARGHERDAHAARLHSLLAASPDLVLVVDADAVVSEVLTPKHALLGLEPGMRVGSRLDQGLTPQAGLELRAAIRRTLSEAHAMRIEYEQGVAPAERWLEAVLVPLPLPSSAPEGARVLVSTRDVSERRKLEAQLRQAQKMEAVGQLAGGVAHDFNNLLAGIIGYTELLRERSDPASIRELADKVLSTSDRAADLVAGLLAFSRRGKRESKPTDLNELVLRVNQILEHTLNRNIQIHVRLAAHPCHTEGDPAQLESALLNLALNARDAMPTGGSLTFTTQVVSDGGAGRFVEVSVEDTGTGIEESVLAHIFEPFFTTKGPGKGSGLGLAAVYGTVQSHGGMLKVESKVGVGTTFKLYFPHTAREPIVSLPARRLDRGAGHILLVDDEESLREAISALLRDLGYQVTTCANGREAVAQHRRASARIQLTILDMSMPELNGPEAAQQIRALNPAARILLASGNSTLTDAEMLALPVDGFLQKPFRSDELSQKLAQLLSGSGVTEADAAAS